MKTDCIKIDECRKPLQLCNGKCKDYKTKKDLQKQALKVEALEKFGMHGENCKSRDWADDDECDCDLQKLPACRCEELESENKRLVEACQQLVYASEQTWIKGVNEGKRPFIVGQCIDYIKQSLPEAEGKEV